MAGDRTPVAPERRMDRLVEAICALSATREAEQIQRIVRRAARDLTGADGATFVLRDGDQCYYVDEDAIGPLWKGSRFPLSACISGWAMLHKEPVAIEDIYADARIPHDAYRPTFVKSLAMVPVRRDDPIAAIGNYWAEPHRPTSEELGLLQALADSTSVALENVEVYASLERRVAARTRELEAANRELESFAFSVSHDLRAPLRGIQGFSQILVEEYGDVLDATALGHLDRIVHGANRMSGLIEDLLRLSRLGRGPLRREAFDVTKAARRIGETLGRTRAVHFDVADGLVANADGDLLTIALENLIGNAWTYTGRTPDPRISIGLERTADGDAFYVRDNGAGFDMAYADDLFQPFRRLHSASEYEGTGVGLATVHRIVARHGGQVWGVGAPGLGATFYFTLPG
jgi:signal transduction histidine kinase